MSDTVRIPSPSQEAAIQSIVVPTTRRRKRTAKHIVAIDVDLRRIHAWSSKFGKLCYEEEDPFTVIKELDKLDPAPDLVLIEVAGPIMHREGGRQRMHHTHRWMIWNIAAVTTLANCLGDVVLVAPSVKWTMGYTEKVRHKIAKADASNHDLRECQTMIAMYIHTPQQWVPYNKFLEEL